MHGTFSPSRPWYESELRVPVFILGLVVVAGVAVALPYSGSVQLSKAQQTPSAIVPQPARLRRRAERLS